MRPHWDILAMSTLGELVAHTITAAPGILIIPPRATYTTALLENHKVLAPIPLYQVDGSAHPTNAATNNHHRGFQVVLVTRWYRRPSL